MDNSVLRHAVRYSEGEMYGDRGEKSSVLCLVCIVWPSGIARGNLLVWNLAASGPSGIYSKGPAIYVARSVIASLRVDCILI